jgi:thiamine biosynthesis lipoprotein
MGTVFHIEMYASADTEASQAAEAAFARAEELEQIMSAYRRDSELMRLSREGAAAPFPASSDLYDVLAKSLWVSELSHGAFDVSIGPLVDLWRAARQTGRLPDPAEISKAKRLVDYRNVELDSAHHTVFLKRAGMKLDLGAIGKGYAADQMLAVLQSRGIRRALVVAGGEVVAGEAPPGRMGWSVGIDTADAEVRPPAGPPAARKPGQSDRAQQGLGAYLRRQAVRRFGAEDSPCTVWLHNAALSTSGDEHQFLELDGRRYSHVIYPQTGWALEGATSTTVIARDSTTADALATALSLMSVSDGMRVAESLPGVAALWVREVNGEWKHYTSRGFPTPCERTSPQRPQSPLHSKE